MSERMLVIGWSGSTWAAVQDGAAAGRLPHVAAMLARGCMVRVGVTPPMVPAALWTTVATGWHADQHGVLGDKQPRADGGGTEPAGRRSWRMPAFWEVLEAAGHRTACVGWPATAPGAAWPGRHVDERFAQASGGDFSTWAIPADAVAPPDGRHDLRVLRIHPADGLAPQIEALWPGAGAVDIRTDQGPVLLGAALAQTGTVHAVATAWAEGQWDLLCVGYDLLQLVAGSTGTPDLATRALGLLDLMLGRLVHLAGAGVSVLVVSPGEWHGQGGFMLAVGRGIAAGGTGVGRLVDVAATVLARFGLQSPTAGTALPALAGAAGARRDIRVPRPPAAAPTPLADPYPDALTAGQAAARSAVAAEHGRNQAQALMGRGQLSDAAAVLDRVRRAWPDDGVALRMAAQCAALLGDAGACQDVAQALLAAYPHGPWGHLALAAACLLNHDDPAADEHLARAAAMPAEPEALLRLGGMQMLRHRHADAYDTFQAAVAMTPHSAEALYGLGMALAALGDWPAAEQALRQSRDRQPLQPLADLQLASVLSAQGRWHESVAVLHAVLAHHPALPGAAAMMVEAQRGLAETIAAAAMLPRATPRP